METELDNVGGQALVLIDAHFSYKRIKKKDRQYILNIQNISFDWKSYIGFSVFVSPPQELLFWHFLICHAIKWCLLENTEITKAASESVKAPKSSKHTRSLRDWSNPKEGGPGARTQNHRTVHPGMTLLVVLIKASGIIPIILRATSHETWFHAHNSLSQSLTALNPRICSSWAVTKSK